MSRSSGSMPVTTSLMVTRRWLANSLIASGIGPSWTGTSRCVRPSRLLAHEVRVPRPHRWAVGDHGAERGTAQQPVDAAPAADPAVGHGQPRQQDRELGGLLRPRGQPHRPRDRAGRCGSPDEDGTREGLRARDQQHRDSAQSQGCGRVRLHPGPCTLGEPLRQVTAPGRRHRARRRAHRPAPVAARPATTAPWSPWRSMPREYAGGKGRSSVVRRSAPVPGGGGRPGAPPWWRWPGPPPRSDGSGRRPVRR